MTATDPLPRQVHDVQDALEAAHAAALAMDGPALRRSLEAAQEALADASAQVEGSTGEAAGPSGLREAQETLREAQAELEAGRLSAMEPLLERVRGYLKGM